MLIKHENSVVFRNWEDKFRDIIAHCDALHLDWGDSHVVEWIGGRVGYLWMFFESQLGMGIYWTVFE